MEYTVIRSKRKTMALTLKNGEVIVRAPLKISQSAIDGLVTRNIDWRERQLEKYEKTVERANALPPLGEAELSELAERAKRIIPQRVAYYAPLIGVTYGKISIRRQKTRWGSCNASGDLSFNCLLMLTPPQVLDSVVVHELCHRKEMNHSRAFYAQILRVFPDYYKHHDWLKQNGDMLLRRVRTDK